MTLLQAGASVCGFLRERGSRFVIQNRISEADIADAGLITDSSVCGRKDALIANLFRNRTLHGTWPRKPQRPRKLPALDPTAALRLW